MYRRGIWLPDDISFGLGTVTVADLFSEKEEALFRLYERNAKRWKRALDVGANIGVHTVIMANCGWNVRAFEPLPVHFRWLCEVVCVNSRSTWRHYPQLLLGALTTVSGPCQFVQICDNTTGSHIKGDKDVVYGKVSELGVHGYACQDHFKWADFAKLDCEGHEADLIEKLTEKSRIELVTEITDINRAQRIYKHANLIKYKMWCQDGLRWKRVKTMFEMPSHHSQGALFLGRREP